MIALFFDTETTGVKSWKDPEFVPKLVQIGAILQDLETGRVVAEQNMIVKQEPGSKIPAGAAAVHGTSDEMCVRFGFNIASADGMFACMAKMADLIVAHNIDYDFEVVKDNMPVSYGLIKDLKLKPQFDTMKQNIYIVKAPLTDKQRAYFGMKGINPDAPYKVPNLTQTFQHYFGRPFDGAHDAMADIRACRDIFLEMAKQGWIDHGDQEVIYTEKFKKMLKKEGAK